MFPVKGYGVLPDTDIVIAGALLPDIGIKIFYKNNFNVFMRFLSSIFKIFSGDNFKITTLIPYNMVLYSAFNIFNIHL